MTDVEPVRLSAQDVRRALLEEATKYPQRRPWEDWEDQILHDFHGKVPNHILAQKLGRTRSMLSHRLEILGLTKRRSSELPCESSKAKAKDRN